MHIVIAGNIGSGKTTLTKMLAKHYDWTPQFEVVKENPYLSDYYNDIQRWSFPLEVFFLKERFRDMLRIAASEKTVIQDRSIFEGVHIFVRNNFEQGNMSDRDYDTFMELFEQIVNILPTPDLMIYLKASTTHLVKNIQKRGRDYEQQMRLDYLRGLNERYDDFIYNTYHGKVLTINVDDLDYEHNPADFRGITEKIDSLLYGLFPMGGNEDGNGNPSPGTFAGATIL